jgi:hypothetical protein
MKTDMPRFLPEARREGIVVKEFEGEVLIYDLERDKAHCLNPLAGNIWRHCDGRATAREIAASLSHEQGLPVDEKVVWLGLEELRRASLLAEPRAEANWPQVMGMSRREAVRRIGLGAAIALPIVASMTAPTAVEAAVSCGAKCQPCTTSVECCGSCFPSVTGCPGAGPECGPPGS